VDPTHNYPELGQRFIRGETALREAQKRDSLNPARTAGVKEDRTRAPPSQLKRMENALGDELDLAWATVLKRTFEAYLRGERPNMYGEMLEWGKA
jgi:WD repeat and SOF domain-containing protein 1